MQYYLEPPARLREALDQTGLSPESFFTLNHGESRLVSSQDGNVCGWCSSAAASATEKHSSWFTFSIMQINLLGLKCLYPICSDQQCLQFSIFECMDHGCHGDWYDLQEPKFCYKVVCEIASCMLSNNRFVNVWKCSPANLNIPRRFFWNICY